MLDKPKRERGGWKRTYIKLFVSGCLQGSIRYQLRSDERGAWYDLILFAAICATPGIISDNDGRPYPHSFIANRLNITDELLERTLEKCKEEGRITEDEHGIHIANWEAYQSEYQRQRPYREAKKGIVLSDEDKQALFKISLAIKKKKRELGRDLTLDELQDIKDQVAKETEVEGE